MSLRRFGVDTTKHVKFLGIDYAAGKRVRRTVQKKRLIVVTKRVGRYKQLAKAAANRILRTGAGPAIRYGASVLGTNSTALARIRRFACAVRGEMRRRSPFGRMKLAKYDPAKQMAVDPIVDWARARWDALSDYDDMRVAWKIASIKVGLAKHPFREVIGPAGALIASARRIGWSCPSPRHLRTDDGSILDLDVVCPAMIAMHAERAYERCTRRESPPWLDESDMYLTLTLLLKSSTVDEPRLLPRSLYVLSEKMAGGRSKGY